MSGGRVVFLNAEQSQISTDKTAIAADGVEVCTVSVTVKNTDRTDGEANSMSRLRGSAVVLSATPSTGVVFTQPTGVLDASGSVTGSFTSTNAATIAINAEVLGEMLSGPATVIVGGGAPPAPDPGDPIYATSFESGTRDNADGFTWSGTGSRVAVSTDEPFGAGTYSLRFRFGPDANNADSTAEQRFNTGREDAEAWIEYQLYVPSNFVVRSQSPGNNKFFVMWANSYSTTGDTQIAFEYDQNAGGNYPIRVLSMNGGADAGGTKFTHILSTAMAGTWIRIRIHLKCATTASSNDGEVEIWRDNTKVYEFLSHDLNFAGGNNFWKNGYFLGWSNSGFAAETDFFVDEVKFYNTDPNWSF